MMLSHKVIMNSTNLTLLRLHVSCAIFLLFQGTSAHASDFFGNPTQIREQGAVSVHIGGGQSDLNLNATDMVATTTVGSVSTTRTVSTLDITNKEDVMFAGASFAISPQLELLASLGSGKNTGQTSSRQSLGLKISPESGSSAIRMGLILRAQRVRAEIQGDFDLAAPYNTVTDGVNLYTINFPIGGSTPSPLHGKEQIKYSRFDVFLGLSGTTGNFRPYGGLALTKITGTDTISLSGTPSVSSWPVGGGTITTNNQYATFNASSRISNSKLVSLVLGFSTSLSEKASLTAELHTGLQDSIMLEAAYSF